MVQERTWISTRIMVSKNGEEYVSITGDNGRVADHAVHLPNSGVDTIVREVYLADPGVYRIKVQARYAEVVPTATNRLSFMSGAVSVDIK
jgi:hypothetical protein